jgi:hypothetical protein
MEELEFHPLAGVFPLIEGEEFEELVASIAERGVDEPVWLYEGKVLDGRNRYRAARAAGRECPQRQFEGDDPVAFVLAQNVQRRHLTPAQRADAVAQLVTARQGRQVKVPAGTFTVQAAAKAAGVSRRSVFRAMARVKDKRSGTQQRMVSLFPGLHGNVGGLGDIEAALAEHDRLLMPADGDAAELARLRAEVANLVSKLVVLRAGQKARPAPGDLQPLDGHMQRCLDKVVQVVEQGFELDVYSEWTGRELVLHVVRAPARAPEAVAPLDAAR